MVTVRRAVLTLILAGHAHARGEPPGMNMSDRDKDVDCMHGRWTQKEGGPGTCVCNPGWRLAGLTDPVNFLKGWCSQYMCESNEMCSREFSGSTCDVPGWNCNCGWKHATGFFSGDQTQHAKCMGLMYFTSDFLCKVALWLMQEIWKFVFVLMSCSLFLGEKQVRCECNEPRRFRLISSLRKMWQAWLHPESQHGLLCNGDCVHRGQWDWWQDLWFEYSWSIYFVDLGLWAYAFLLVLFLTGVVVGSMFLLGLCILTIVLAILVACLMGVCSIDCNGADGCNCLDCCNCRDCCSCLDGWNCCDCCNCLDCCCADAPGQGYSSYDSYFLIYGPQPIPDCSCSHGRCDCCPRLWLCRPLTWVLVRFPEMPANMWGGWIGRLMGTHQYTEESRRYQGGWWLIDMLSFRTRTDLHSDSGWRGQVYNFVFSDPEPALQHAPQQSHMPRMSSLDSHQQQQRPLVASRFPHLHGPGRTHAVVRREPWRAFTVEEDGCQVSTFEDYLSGTCWVCCEKHCEKFHMWVQCGHMFCSACSDAMMQRHMPCPLCRQVSTLVVEGPHPEQESIFSTSSSINGCQRC